MRFTTFDTIRSVMILVMLFFHTVLFFWKNAPTNRFVPPNPPPMDLQVIMFFLTMGGSFFLISGSVNGFRFSFSKRNEKQQKKFCNILAIKGVVFYLFHFFSVSFLTHETGRLYYWLNNDVVQRRYWKEVRGDSVLEEYVHNDPISAIGMNYLFLGISFRLFMLLSSSTSKKNIEKRKGKMFIFFFILGSIVFILTPNVRILLYPIVDYFKERKDFTMAILINIFCGDWFPVFPNFGYLCYGITIGIAISMNERRRYRFILFQGIMSLIWMLVGISVLYAKFDGYIYNGLYEEMSERGMIFRSFLQYIHIGTSFILLTFCFYFLDYSAVFKVSQKHSKEGDQRAGKSSTIMSMINNVGSISFTIFSLEGVVKALLKNLIFDQIWEDWDQELHSVLVVGGLFCIFWIVVANVWNRIRYFGSLEYIVSKVSKM